MKNIAILGCENSHANSFLTFIKEREEFSDVNVIGVYSDDIEAANKLHDTFGVAVMDNYADAVGKVDGIVITARHGDNHYKYAKPYIASHIPMFVDKPITVSEEDALCFMKELAANNIKVSGGSSLKHDDLVIALKNDRENNVDGNTLGGFIRAPYQSENEYGGFYFYAQHLVEMVCEIYGRFPLSVCATKKGSQISVLFRYEDYDCHGLFCDKSYCYFASRMAAKGSKGAAIPSTKEWSYREFREFYHLMTGEGSGACYKELIAPVYIMNAIDRALASGTEEKITYPEI